MSYQNPNTQGPASMPFMFPAQSMDETKLIPFENEYIERDGIVTLKPLRPNQFKNESLRFGGFKGKAYFNQDDKDINVRNRKYWIGHPLVVYSDGSYKWKKIEIMDGRVYYLNNPEDAREFHIIRHHFSVVGSPNASGAARWIMESEKKKANQQMDKANKFVLVYDYLKAMSDERIKSFGRLNPFNLDPDNNSVETIRGQLIERAMQRPELFDQYLKDARYTAVYEAFKRGQATGIIVEDHERGYLFNGNVPMGLNENQAVQYMLNRNDLVVTIDAESKRLEKEDTERNKAASDARAKIDSKPPEPVTAKEFKMPEIPDLQEGSEDAEQGTKGKARVPINPDEF